MIGNLAYINTRHVKRDGIEENRLLASDDYGLVKNYWYDADGERVVKQHGGNRGLYVNSAGRDSLTETTAFTLYVNPYVTWTEGGKYVKHVYMGGSRVASRLGVAHLMGNNPIAALGGVLPGHVLKDSMQKAAVVTSYGVFGVPYGGEDRTAVLPYSNEPGNFLGDFTDPNGLEGRQYFYHPDHLGSSTVITDEDGNVVQHIEYMPYGEVFMEEDNDTWNTPYKFNGKEYDGETGLYYYGARYYNPKLCLWINTDNEQETYPYISTYTYCINNPIILLDPDGNKVIPTLYINGSKKAASYYHSPNNFKIAMGRFAKTSFGRQILADFTPKGSSIFGVKGNGKYADFNLHLQEERIENPEKRTATFFNSRNNSWIHAQTSMEIDAKGKPEFTILFDLDYSSEELTEFITHEFTIHLSNYSEILDAYMKTGNSHKSKKIWSNNSETIEHRNILEKNIKKQLPGTKNYNKTRDEIIKNEPQLKKIFDNANK